MFNTFSVNTTTTRVPAYNMLTGEVGTTEAGDLVIKDYDGKLVVIAGTAHSAGDVFDEQSSVQVTLLPKGTKVEFTLGGSPR
jgi:hypothetical protein